MNTLDLQRSLFRLGYDVGGCDGVEGPMTQAAVSAFTAACPGTLDTMIAAALVSVPPLILAAHFTPANRPHSAPIDLIVEHTMEAPEKPKTAFNVASWFAGTSAPQASAHFCVDDAQVIQCVLECDVAWAAPGANSNGVHIEHAGYASQTPDQWDDDYSNAVLANSAKLCARLARRFNIPIIKLSADDLKAGKRGFCGHADVTAAFCKSGHSDPGPNYPWVKYLALVQSAFDGT